MRSSILSRCGFVAALYAIFSLALSAVSFGPVQVRISEMLLLLVLYDRRYSWGLIIGCLTTNLFSPLGMVDVVFGTAGTALCCLAIAQMKKKWQVPLPCAIITGLGVGAELSYLYGIDFLPTAATVFLGELLSLCLGVLLFTGLEKNKKLMDMLAK